jgi:hypothetical protein
MYKPVVGIRAIEAFALSYWLALDTLRDDSLESKGRIAGSEPFQDAVSVTVAPSEFGVSFVVIET